MFPVFRKALRDSRMTLLWLCVGLGIYAALMMAFYPTVAAQSAEFDDIMENYPQEILNLFYTGSTSFQFADPGAYTETYLTTWTLLILGGMMTGQVFNSITNAERSGSMDMLLSLPVSRRQVLLGQFLRTVVSILLVTGLIYLIAAGGTLAIEEFDMNLGRLALVMLGMGLVVLVQVSLSYLLACVAPASARWAAPIAYTFFFGTYLLNGFSSTIEFVSTLEPLLLFSYYSATDVAHYGIQTSQWLTMLGASLVFMVGAFWAFERKEVGI